MQKKLSLISIYQILKEYSDEDHILSRKELCDLLETIYLQTMDRKTFSSHIRTLIEFGIDISTFEDNGKGYYLIEREFEKSEIHLLCNAVFASHFIPEQDSSHLIDKLLTTQSKHVKKEFHDNVYVRNLNKTINKEFFLNIEILLEAMRNKKVVSYNYMKYDLHKQLVPRKSQKYIIHPYYIVYANENYYLICRNDVYEGLSHYRIDKIKNITILDAPIQKLQNSFDPYTYAKSKIYMYGGPEERVTLKCDNLILDDMIDRFGTGIRIQKSDEQHFYAMLKSSTQGLVYFAMQYIKYCEVLEPKSLRDEIREILINALDQTYPSH